MVISKVTILGVEMVLKGHLTEEQIVALVRDLHKVPGNLSWRETISVLREDLDPDYNKASPTPTTCPEPAWYNGPRCSLALGHPGQHAVHRPTSYS